VFRRCGPGAAGDLDRPGGLSDAVFLGWHAARAGNVRCVRAANSKGERARVCASRHQCDQGRGRMTGDDKKRATLDFGDDLDTPPAPPVDPNAVKAATRRAAFREPPNALALCPSLPGGPTRRTRRKTGRTEQFAPRLRADTLEAIYAYADRHEITLAETIERAMSALINTENSG